MTGLEYKLVSNVDSKAVRQRYLDEVWTGVLGDLFRDHVPQLLTKVGPLNLLTLF